MRRTLHHYCRNELWGSSYVRSNIWMVTLQMMILEQQYHDDLKKELKGVTHTSAGSNVEKETSGGEKTVEPATKVQENVDDTADMGKLMMSRKKRKLLEAMQVCSFYPSYADLSSLIPRNALICVVFFFFSTSFTN